jgi:hypothetical protein
MDPIVSQAVGEASEEYFRAKFVPIRNIYLDIEVLQDFRLGALLHLITTQTELDYIRYRLKDYSNRLGSETMRYFPAIKDISEKDLDECIANKDKHRSLVVISPTTEFYMGLPDMIRHINENNSRCATEVYHVNIHIGTNSVILDQDLKENIIFQFKNFDKTLNTIIYNRPLSGMEEEIIRNIDITAVDNIKQFTNDPVIRKHFSDSDFLNKQVLAHPYIDVELLEGETSEQLLSNTKTMLDVYCDFDYIQRKVEIKG